MKLNLKKKITKEDLAFKLNNLSRDDFPEVEIFQRMVEISLFNKNSSKRFKAQKAIKEKYHNTIRRLDLLNGSEIYFELTMPEGEFSCILGTIPKKYLNKPYYPVLFFD